MYKALCLFNDQFAHIYPIELALHNSVKFVYTTKWYPEEIEKESPDIIIGINEHHVGVSECYAFAKTKQIPILTIQDGILEWRHMFENPLYNGITGPPLHAPVLADKIACIGLTSAALIGDLGNWHKVELTGMPKMDDLRFDSSPAFNTSDHVTKRILILTSSKPWFTDQQREVVVRQLTDLKERLSKRTEVQVVWRVTKELPELLGIENTYTQKSTAELAKLIQDSDAVITTISTTILEAQLLERPTAIIDYFNTCNFVGARWAIRHSSQIDGVLDELLNPTRRDKIVQDFYLHQNISRGPEPAAKKIAQLISLMIEYNQNNPGMLLPANLLKMSFYDQNLSADIKKAVINDTVMVQSDVNLWQEVINRLKYQNQQLENQLKSRSIYSMLYKIGRSVKKIIKLK